MTQGRHSCRHTHSTCAVSVYGAASRWPPVRWSAHMHACRKDLSPPPNNSTTHGLLNMPNDSQARMEFYCTSVLMWCSTLNVSGQPNWASQCSVPVTAKQSIQCASVTRALDRERSWMAEHVQVTQLQNTPHTHRQSNHWLPSPPSPRKCHMSSNAHDCSMPTQISSLVAIPACLQHT
jgi:hypothetical protein